MLSLRIHTFSRAKTSIVLDFLFHLIPIRRVQTKKFCIFLKNGREFEIEIVLAYAQNVGGLTGRPRTVCPCTNLLGPLVPKLIVPGDTTSLH